MDGIPPELKLTIIRRLPPKELENLAMTSSFWLSLCRMVIFRSLDLMGKKRLEEWLNDYEHLRNVFFKYVRKLSCQAYNDTLSHQEAIGVFLESHLSQFQRLFHLTLRNGEIPSNLLDTQYSFASTLKVLELEGCNISFGGLVTLLNQFLHLDHLIFDRIKMKDVDEVHTTLRSRHPKKLRLVETGLGVLNKLLTLNLAYEELSLEIYDGKYMASSLIEHSKGSLVRLGLGNTLAGMCHNNPTVCLKITDGNPRFSLDPTISLKLSGFDALRQVTMESKFLKGGLAAGLISSITSQKLREIILKGVDYFDEGWKGVENALCGLVGKLGNNIEVTLRVFSSSHLGDCTNFFQNLPKNCRVVLMKEKSRGEAVVHDSYIGCHNCRLE